MKKEKKMYLSKSSLWQNLFLLKTRLILVRDALRIIAKHKEISKVVLKELG